MQRIMQATLFNTIDEHDAAQINAGNCYGGGYGSYVNQSVSVNVGSGDFGNNDDFYRRRWFNWPGIGLPGAPGYRPSYPTVTPY